MIRKYPMFVIVAMAIVVIVAMSLGLHAASTPAADRDAAQAAIKDLYRAAIDAGERAEALAGEVARLKTENEQLRAKLGGRETPPVTPPVTPPAHLIDLKAGDKFPAEIAAGHTVRLARGATFTLPPKVKLRGDGIRIIGAPGDGPLPVVTFTGDAMDAFHAGVIEIADLDLRGKGRFIHLYRDGFHAHGLRIGAMGSFVEQAKPVADVTIEDCEQYERVDRYFAFIDGPRWTIKNNRIGPSRDENIVRSSSGKSTQLLIEGNTVVASTKGTIDIRKGAGIIRGNTFAGGAIRFGEIGPDSGDVLIEKNKSLDGAVIRIVGGGGKIVVRDNAATVEVTEPNAGRGYESVTVKSDRAVTWFGNLNDRTARWDIDATTVKQVVGGRVVELPGRQSK